MTYQALTSTNYWGANSPSPVGQVDGGEVYTHVNESYDAETTDYSDADLSAIRGE